MITTPQGPSEGSLRRTLTWVGSQPKTPKRLQDSKGCCASCNPQKHGKIFLATREWLMMKFDDFLWLIKYVFLGYSFVMFEFHVNHVPYLNNGSDWAISIT